MARFDMLIKPPTSPAHGAQRGLTLLTLAVAGWCHTAQADEWLTRAQASTVAAATATAAQPELEVSRSVVDAGERAGAYSFSSNGFAKPGASNLSTQTMLWSGRTRLSLGIGVSERPLAPAGTAPQAVETGLLLGVAFNGKHRTSLVWQSEPQADGGLRMVFSSRKPYDDLRRGALMKFQVSEQTTVSLRPRRGRVGLMLQSWWW